MKNKREKDRTEEIRAMLSFLQFVENKIIRKQVFKINSMDMEEIKNFSQFMAMYIK